MPSGKNFWNQTLNKRRRRNAGSLSQLQRQLWFWIGLAHDAVLAAVDAGDNDNAIRWMHAGNQVANTYTRIVLEGEFEARLAALEASTGNVGKPRVVRIAQRTRQSDDDDSGKAS